MTTIRSKGGLPLMIGGQVAGADSCCQCGSLCPGPLLVTARFAIGIGFTGGDPYQWCQALRLPFYYPALLQGPIITCPACPLEIQEIRYDGRFAADEKSGADVSAAMVRFFIPRNPREGSKVRLEIRPAGAPWSATYEADYVECPNCRCYGQLMYEFKPSDLVGGSSAFCGGNVEFVVTGSCWRDCEDFCAYRLDITQPDSVAVTGRFSECGFLRPERRTTVAYALGASLPSGSTVTSDITKSYSRAISTGNYTLAGIVEHVFNGTVPNSSSDCLPSSLNYSANPRFYANCGISATVYCTNGKTPNPFAVELSASVNVQIGSSDEKGNECEGAYVWSTTAIYELPSACRTVGNRHCYPVGGAYRILNTPVEFSANGETTSLGPYQDGYVREGTGNLNDIAASIGNAMKNALAATFRVTSRPTCLAVPCSCNAPLGGMYVTFGNLASKYNGVPFAFVLNSSTLDFQREITNFVQWQGPFGFYEWEEYDEDGPRDGNGNCTQAMTRQRAELYCDIVDGVSQWYVLFTSFCFKYDAGGTYTHQSYDEWVGKIDCYKACADAENFIEADEPVPMGEPYDIEYIGRTTVAGYLECEPPPRATISLRQINAC